MSLYNKAKKNKFAVIDEQIQNLENCKFVKTILMLFVILGHSVHFWTGDWFTANPAISSLGLRYFSDWINSFHVYAFTLVSGYIFAYKMNGGGYNTYTSFLKNKAKRLLIPYAFIAIIWVIPVSCYFLNWNIVYVVKAFGFCSSPSQLWFVWMLFWTFAIAWPLWNIFVSKPGAGAGITLVFYCIGIIGNKVFPNVFCIWNACQHIPFFYIGIRIRIKEENTEFFLIEKMHWILWGIADIILFLISLYIKENIGLIWNALKIIFTFILHICGAVTIFVALQRMARKVNWKKKTFLLLSTYSMPMYLFHQQIIYFMILMFNGKINPYINACINFIVAIIGSFLISIVLMKWKITRKLIGEK